MRVLAQRPSWFDDAACRGMAESLGGAERDRLFFPTPGQASAGKSICADCPVATECAEYALDQSFAYGIWGGMSERQRRSIRSQRRRAG